MTIKSPVSSPITNASSVSNTVRSQGEEFSEVKMLSKTIRIGSEINTDEQNDSLSNRINASQLNPSSIIVSNSGVSYAPSTNSEVAINQPLPLVFAEFSSEARFKMVDILAANKMETQVDRLILKKIFEILEKNENGNRIIKESIENIKNQFNACDEILESLNEMLQAKLQCDRSLQFNNLSIAASNTFNNIIFALNTKNYLQLLTENYDPNNLISITSALTSFNESFIASKDLQYIFWLSLNDAKDSIQFGLSPGGILEQNTRKDVITLQNVRSKDSGFKTLKEVGIGNNSTNTLDSSNYSIDRIPYPTSLQETDKLIYYCGLIVNELLISAGMGSLEGSLEGQIFDSSTDPIHNCLGTNDNSLSIGVSDSIYSSTFLKSDGTLSSNNNNTDVILLSSNEKGSKINYIDNFFKNINNNSMPIYDLAIENCFKKFDEAENFLKKVLFHNNENKSILTKSGLLARIISDFCLMLENLISENNFNNSTKLSLVLLKKNYGFTQTANVAGSSRDAVRNNNLKRNLKIFNQKVIANKLKFSKQNNNSNFENKSITINVGNIDPVNEAELVNQINSIVNSENLSSGILFDNYYDNLSSDPIVKEVSTNTIVNFFNFKKLIYYTNNDIDIYDIIIKILEDIENEAFNLVSDSNSEGSFLKNNGTTKYSGFDSLTITNIIFECFSILARIFTDIVLVHEWTRGNFFKYNKSRIQSALNFLQSVSDSLTNKNTNFLIRSNGSILTNSNIMENDPIGFAGRTITPLIIKKMADKALAEDEIFWNLYAISKSIFLNVKDASQSLIRYGKILNSNTSSTIKNLSNGEKNIINFIKDSNVNSIDYISQLNEFSINKSKLKLKDFESLQKPYDIADLPDEIYDACLVLLENKNYYSKGKLLAVGLINGLMSNIQNANSQKFDDAYFKAKISRTSELEQDVKYKDINLNFLRLRYVITEESVKKAVIKLKGNSNTNFSLEQLATEIEFYDLSEGGYGKLPFSNDTLSILESYLICKLLEINFDIVLEPHYLSANGYAINYQKLLQIIDILAINFGISNLRDYLITNDGTSFRFLSNEEINKKLENLTKSLDFNGNSIYFDSAVDFGLISTMHTLSDSFIFRDDQIKNIVFSLDKMDAIYGFSFDQGSMEIENNKSRKLDFDLVDAYFVSGEIS